MAENPAQKADMVFRAIWNHGQVLIGDKGGEILGGLTESVVKSAVKDNDALAERAGEFAREGFRYTTAFSVNARDFMVEAKKSRKRVGELLEDVEPFLVSEFGKSGRGKLWRTENEVISHKRHQLVGQTKGGMYKATAGLSDKLPDIMGGFERRRIKLDQNQDTATDALELTGGEDSGIGTAVETTLKAKGAWNQRIDNLAASDFFSPENKETRKLIDLSVRTGVPGIQEYLENEAAEQFGKISAFDMIKSLAEQAQSGSGDLTHVSTADGEYLPLSDYIISVFKQHQEDVGGKPLNDRFPRMPELRKACDRIAREIDKNLLDPMALVALVGEREILNEHLQVAGTVKVDEALRNVWTALERGESVDASEFISETAFATKEDFQDILKEMPAADKPFFASLFPIAVLKEMGGLKDDEIDDLKARGAEEFSDKMVEAIRDISQLQGEELQRYGLTEEEGRLIRELADVLEVEGAQEVKDELHGALRENVTEAVRNARGYWQDRVAGRSTGKGEELAAEDEGVSEERGLSHVERLKEAQQPSGEVER